METLLTLTLSGSALTLLLLALRLVLRRKLPSAVYYYAWLLVLLRFLLPLPGLIPLGQAAPEASPMPLPTARETIYLQAEDTAFPVAVPPADPAEEALPAPETAAAPLPETAQAETPADAATPAPQARPGFDWRSPRLWLSLWALGAALCFLWPLTSYLRFTAALRPRLREPEEALRALYASFPGRKPALSVCPGLPSPLMFGVLRPRIVLPAEIDDPRQLRNVLRHELCHWRRRDPLYKWFAAAVLSLHWFNPLSWLIRRELNRACELSCDETLLRAMDRDEKQAYGETLLRMAASAALPAGVVATTFSTEKKNLKERLEQIMHYKKSKGRVLAALLALLLLCGCGVAAGPAGGTDASIVPVDETSVRVSDVDGLLAALAPNTTVILEPGDYDLSAASDYGRESGNPYYRWVQVPGADPEEPGYELQILGAENLTLRGAGEGETVLRAEPRYANVLRFQNCPGLRVEGLTAGHSTAPGFCSGGVLRLETCSDAVVDGCGLFGCGTIGVDLRDSSRVSVTGCHIYECSYSAVYAYQCRKVLVEGCEIERNGTKIEGAAAVNLFAVNDSEDFTVVDCSIHDNLSQILLNSTMSKGVLFLSNRVEQNEFATTLFQMERVPVTVDGCSFRDVEALVWVYGNGVFPVDTEGRELDAAALQAMEYREIDPAAVQSVSPVPAPALELPVGGSVTVHNADELLAAIGPDRTILLDGALFDLSTASDYGGTGTEYYYWKENHDGPELIISGVRGLTIRAASEDPAAVTIAAVPRYVNVLSFRDCEDIRLVGFTAGHTEEPGACTGGVLFFSGCHGVELEACRLYGCGILGLDCRDCTGVTARDCEIYDCSQGGVYMWRTDGVRFLGCDIHDVPSPALNFRECGDLSWNEQPIPGNGKYNLLPDGGLQSLAAEQNAGTAEMWPEPVHPYDLLSPRPFTEGETLDFARAVQTNIAEGNWEALSRQLFYPFHIFTGTQSIDVQSPEEFLALDLDGLLTPEYRRQIAEAPLDEYGASDQGNTFCGGRLAFGRDRLAEGPEQLRLTVIVLQGALTDNRIAEALEVYAGNERLTDISLHVGESATLDVRVYPLGLFPDAEVRWQSTNPDAVRLTPTENGRRCRVEALAYSPNGVMLTAECRGLRFPISLWIPQNGEAPAPTPAP